ncbi:MAG TPA: YhcN/YlaJ family sporulation lipoprotein [Bacillales bacterium]
MKAYLINGIFIIGTAFFLLAGCASQQNQSSEKDVNFVPAKWETQDGQTVAEQVEGQVAKRKGIKDVQAIPSKKELLVAIRLKTFDRFNSQQIVKKIEKKLQKQYPKRKVQVSSDKKVYMEIAELESKIRQGEIDAKERKNKMKRIHKFLKEQ